MKTHYEILEIPVSASSAEVKEAHQKLSKKYHPENNDGVTFFNDVYNQIQNAYRVLSNEALRSEYDTLNNIKKSESPSVNNLNNPNINESNIKRRTKPHEKKHVFIKVTFFLITACVLIAAGYFVYNSLPMTTPEIITEQEGLVFNADNSNEENIRNLLIVESDRDFKVISTYYSENIERYWDSENINIEELKAQYTNAWSKSSDSKNKILNIERVDHYTLHIETEFSFTDKNTNNTVSFINLNKYVFNDKGLITQVYTIDHIKEYSIYRDVDFINISNEEKIRRLLKAEDKRDFNKIASFYSSNIGNYWHLKQVTIPDIKEQYESAWKESWESKNTILNVDRIDDNTIHVEIEFNYIDKTTNNFISSVNLNKYVFNDNGLITQVYNIDHLKNYDNFRDEDFSTISNEEKIIRLLRAEDSRDFNKIASFYSNNIDRYWHLKQVTIQEIKKQYEHAWIITSQSQNTVIELNKTSPNTYLLSTRFEFVTTRDNNAEVRYSDNIYVFNWEGLITEVYGANLD